MAQRTFYQKLEPAIGIAGLAVGLAALLFAATAARPMEPARLIKWLGLALLIQGLIRDLILLATLGLPKGPGERKLLICLESTIGAGLVALAFFLNYLDTQRLFHLSPAWLILIFSALWLCGFTTRDWVLELRRDPNHLNLLVGIPRRKAT